ncbi:hypothetical protein [uncultured Pontibacter sp.]|uniref:hypothetical protein n=1 Tax=uncultured Pontibacter sp. TaxID=453356 RepID=UPI002632A8B5|nr:hypothetical protein [uncultured Pontibacter sp.]
MKRTIAATVFTLLFSSVQLLAQNKSQLNTLVYDFESKKFYVNEYTSGKDKKESINRNKDNELKNLNKVFINYNKGFNIEVKNINRYLYNIEIATESVDLGSAPPALFNQLFLGANYAEGLLATLTKEKGQQGLHGESNRNDFEEALKQFLSDYNQLVDRKLLAYEYGVRNFDKAPNEVKYSVFAKKLLELRIIYQAYNAELIESLAAINKEIDAAEKKLESCKKEKAELETKLKSEKNPNRIKEIKNQIDKLKCEENDLNRLKGEKKLKEQLKQDGERLWESTSKISDSNLAKTILFNRNLHNDHLTYTSPPIYPNGNLHNISLKISPSDSSLVKKWNIMPLENDSLSFSFFVKGKTFVSFSSGPFVGFGNKLIYNTYNWQPQPNKDGIITDSTQYKLVPTGSSNTPLGLAAFANIGRKISRGTGVAISPGVGITIESNPKPVYFIGASLLTGENQQFNISTGFAFMNTEGLNKEFYNGIQDKLFASKPSEIEYTKKLNYGGFISISYTLFTLNKTKGANAGSRK